LTHLSKKIALALMLATGLHAANAAELVVSAAASLTNAFTELVKAYEAAHPETNVVLNFAGSGTLLQQIDRGAPVDVFASADEITMNRAQSRHLVVAETRIDFAHNSLVLIGPSDSQLQIDGLGALRSNQIHLIAISNPDSVPVGRYARAALKAAGLWDVLMPKYINTQHVRQSLDYVARGEVDVGFVYATDAAVMPDKVRVLRRIATTTPITYPIAVVADSRNKTEAERFIEFVRSAQGESILQRAGFDPP
jgi:molybdate transport system substrate-binding protein